MNAGIVECDMPEQASPAVRHTGYANTLTGTLIKLSTVGVITMEGMAVYWRLRGIG